MAKTYQDVLDEAGSTIAWLREPPRQFDFAYPPVHTNWREEQKAWMTTATIFNQSYHMTDLYISGPDALKLLSDTSVNSYKNFGPGRAKQYLAVNEDGYVVSDAILFGLGENEFVLNGTPIAPTWIEYQAEIGGYDVKIEREERSNDGPAVKRVYRYNLEGPNAWKILEAAAGQTLERIKFFRMGEIAIAGQTVQALNHTMGGVPGQDLTGLELFGPAEEEREVLDAILAAGEQFGLRRGGARAYFSTLAESGWVGYVIPAIYGEGERAYREWLPADGYETHRLHVHGSFVTEDVEDYYATPWDLSYGHMIKFDHDFIGRAALEKMAENPSGRKVWLKWNREDAERVLASGSLDFETGPKEFLLPMTQFAFDSVLDGDRRVGLALVHGYTVNLGAIVAIARVDAEVAVDGKEVEILWGDADGGASSPAVAPHTQIQVRATVSTKSPMA